MRSRLIRGRLSPEPQSIADAERRAELLDREIEKIRAQLCDAARPALFAGRMVAYDQWAHSARSAQRAFREELRLTRQWLDDHEGERLLREAWQLLKTLERETDLDEEEAKLVRQLDAYFAGERIRAKQPQKERA